MRKRRAADIAHKLLSGKSAAMLVDLVTQPFSQRSKFSAAELVRQRTDV